MNAPTATSPFVLACRGLPVPVHPVWYMRQAGRSLPEYRATRAGVEMLTACFTPDLVTEITLQPVRRYGVDAAILFSDIVVPLKAAGVDVRIEPGTGPVFGRPVRDEASLRELVAHEPGDVSAVAKAVGSLVAELGQTPLIGFAGAPFTLACYLVEGGPSKNFEATRALMYGEPELWDRLMRWLTGVTTAFLTAQANAGVSAVQLFDSWAGILGPSDYRRAVLRYSGEIFAVASGLEVPAIHFGVGTGEILGLLGEAGADVVGVDWRVPLDEAARRVPGKALQGNLDPALLLSAPWPVVAARAQDVLVRGTSAPGHIFNLGHGVLPQTDPDVLARLTDLVHETPPGR